MYPPFLAWVKYRQGKELTKYEKWIIEDDKGWELPNWTHRPFIPELDLVTSNIIVKEVLELLRG